MIMADIQFDCLTDALAEMQIQMTPLAKGEHEKFVEHNNQFMKERCICSIAALPKKSPKRMIIRLVHNADFWINSFWRGQGGVSDTMGPRLIMNGIKLFMAHAKYQFGQCFQTHEEKKSLIISLCF